MRKLSILAVAALLGSAPAAAQQGHGQHPMPMQGQDMHGMRHCTAMMGGPPPHVLLQHRDALGLSADQVSRLEALQARARETALPHMGPAMQSHMAAARLLEGDSPDFQGYEAGLREAADHMVRAHVAMARVAVEAGRVLTPAQRGRLDELGRGMMGAGDGAMDMMGCMMMGEQMDHGVGGGHNR